MDTPLIDLIKQRRSIRSFKDKPVEKDIIEEIVQAGRFAPSAKNRQPWKFIVITNRDYIQGLSNEVKNQLKKILKRRFIYKFLVNSLKNEKTVRFLAGVSFSKSDTIFFNAPVLVFIVTKKGLFNDESCACCAQNMMLAAHSLGMGSCWIGFASVLGLNKKNSERLQIPKDHHIAAALVFGYPDKKPGKASLRRVDADIIHWID